MVIRFIFISFANHCYKDLIYLCIIMPQFQAKSSFICGPECQVPVFLRLASTRYIIPNTVSNAKTAVIQGKETPSERKTAVGPSAPPIIHIEAAFFGFTPDFPDMYKGSSKSKIALITAVNAHIPFGYIVSVCIFQFRRWFDQSEVHNFHSPFFSFQRRILSSKLTSLCIWCSIHT